MADHNLVFKLLAEVDPSSAAKASRDLQAAIKPVQVGFQAPTADQFARQVGAANQALEKSHASAIAAGQSFNQVSTAATSAAASIRVVGTASLDSSRLLENLGNQAGLAARRFVAMSAVATTMVALTATIKNSITEAVAFEHHMAQVGQVSGQTKGQLTTLAGQIGDLSTSLGISARELADTSIQLKKLGLDAQGTEQALNAIAKASLSVNFDGVKGATDAAVVAMRQFRIEAGQLDEALGGINAVSNKFNVNAKDITEAMRVAGSTFRQAGGDMNELIALFTSAKSTTEEAAGGIASSLRLVFSRVQRNDVAVALKDLGVNLRYTQQEAERLGNTKLENQFVGTLEAVRRLKGALNDLQSTDPRYVSLLEQLGGARNVSRVIPLLQETSKAEEALLAAQSGAITSTNAQEKALETLSGRASQVSGQFAQLGRNIVGSSDFQGFARAALDTANALAKVLDALRPLVPLMAALATVKIAQNFGNITSAFARRFAAAPSVNNTEILTRAGGGAIPGVGDTDSVPAMLTPGEFVINKQAAAAIGLPTLHRMNAQHFAGGGIVKNARAYRLRRKLDQDLSINAVPEFSSLYDHDKASASGSDTDSGNGLGNLEEFFEFRRKLRLEKLRKDTGVTDAVTVDPTAGKPVFDPVAYLASLQKKNAGGLIRRYATGGSVDPYTNDELRAFAQENSLTDLRKYVQQVTGQKNLPPADLLKLYSTYQRAIKKDPSKAEIRLPSAVQVAQAESLRKQTVARKQGKLVTIGDAEYTTDELKTAYGRAPTEHERALGTKASTTAFLSPENIGELVEASLPRLKKLAKTKLGADKTDEGELSRQAYLQAIRLNPFTTSKHFPSEIREQFANYGEVDVNNPKLQKYFANLLFSQKQSGGERKQGAAATAISRELGKLNRQKATDSEGFERLETGTPLTRFGQDREFDPALLAERNLDPDFAAQASTKQRQQASLAKQYALEDTLANSGITFDAEGNPIVNQSTRQAGPGNTPSVPTRARSLRQAARAPRSNIVLPGETAPGVRPQILTPAEATPIIPSAPTYLNRLRTPKPEFSDNPLGDQRAYELSVAAGKSLSKRYKAGAVTLANSHLFGGSTASPSIYGFAPEYGPFDVRPPQPTFAGSHSVLSPELSSPLGFAPDYDPRQQGLQDIFAQVRGKARRQGGYGVGQPPELNNLRDKEAALYQNSILTGADGGRPAAPDQNIEFSQLLLNKQRAVRQQAQQITDPLAIRQSLRSQGVSLAEELAGSRGQRLEEIDAAKNAKLDRSGALEFAQTQKKARGIAENNKRLGLGSASFTDIAELRGSQAIDAQGGASLLSARTQQQIVAQQALALEKELVAAETALLQKLNPRIQSSEALRIAEENIARALKNEEAVVRNASGQAIGTAGTVGALQGAGISPTLSRGDRIRGFFSRVGGSLRRGDLGGAIGNIPPGAGIAATLALPYISQGIAHLGGTAEQAAASPGNEGRYKTAQATSGALQGAVLGGTAGSLFGPWGVAIGAAVGGVYGFVSSLKEAEKEIRDTKINNALSEFADKIHTLSTGSLDSATLQGAREKLSVGLAETTAKNKGEATHFFSGFDYGEFSELQKKSLRQQFGNQLPEVQQTLFRQAEGVARTSPGKGVDDVLKDVRNGGNGLNAELISLTARVRGVPLGTVLDELKKVIDRTQQDLRVQQQAQAARRSEEGNINAFHRLLLNVEAAASSLDDLKRQASVLGDAFSGASQTIRVTAHADNLQGIGRNDKGFLEPLSIVSKIGGATGQSLYRTGESADEVARVLPGVLARVAATNPNQGEDFATRTQKGVIEALGLKTNKFDELPKEIQNALNVVTRGLNEKGGNGNVRAIFDELQVDSSKFAEKLLSPLTEPVKDVGGKVAKAIEDEANRFVDGLQQFRRQLEVIGEGKDRAANIGVASTRNTVEQAAVANYQQGRALDFLSLPQLQAGLQSRQERLTGFGGALANNPQAIAGELGRVQAQVRQAADRQQQVFEQTGGKGPEFRAAAEQLGALRDRAANLQRALQLLADYSERNAAAQEKLARLNQEQDSRRGLGERFFSGDPEERLRIAQGAQLAQEANRRGSLDTFTPDQQKSVIDFLNSARNITLSLPRGQQTGQDALNQLIDNSAGGIFKLNPGQQNEQEGLRNVIAENYKKAEEAQAALVKNLEKNSNDFITNLRATHEQFYQKLANVFLVREQLQQKKADLGSAGEAARTAKTRQEQGGILASIGINDGTGLAAAQNGRSTIEGYAATFENLRRQKNLSLNATVGFNRFYNDEVAQKVKIPDWVAAQGALGENLTKKSGSDIETGLVNNLGLSPEQAAGAVKRFSGIYKNNYLNKFPNRLPAGQVLPEDEAKEVVRTSLRQAISEQLTFGKGGTEELRDDLAKRAGGLRGLGLNQAGLNAQLDKDKGAEQLREALNAFTPNTFDLKGLGEDVNKTKSRFEELNTQIEALNAKLKASGEPAQQPQARAGGGSIFQTRGTDTVPAMLTPGEFVVNAASAQANYGALQKINAAKGPAYLADGGPTDFELWKRQKAEAEASGDTDFQRWKARQGGERPQTDFQKWKGRQAAAAVPDAGPHDAGPQVEGPDPAAAVEEMRERAREALAGGNAFDPAFVQVAQQGVKAAEQQEAVAKKNAAGRARRGGQAMSPLEAQLLLFAIQNPGGASAGALAQVQAIRQYDVQHAANVKHAERLNKIANTEGDLPQVVRAREQAKRGLAGLAARDAYFAQLPGIVGDRYTNAGNVANFQRRQAFGYIGFDQNQTGIGLNSLQAGEHQYSLYQRQNFALQEARRNRVPGNLVGLPFGFASGGIVPGIGSTDHVPALLTPGEGVLTKGAVSAIGGPQGVQTLNRGGMVKAQYLAGGGQATGGADFGAFSESASKLTDAINSFAGTANALAEALSQMPRTLTGNFNHTLTVTLNGGEFLTRVQPELERMVLEQAKEQIGKLFKEHLPEAGVSV